MKILMTEMKKSWEDEYSIPFCEVDTKKEVFLPTLWNFMQETAWHHADHLRVGYSDLVKHQHFWVLSRLSIQMEVYPRWGDRIRIRTWLTGMGRLFALRNFSVTNSKGDILGTAKSAWLVLDLKNRRPQRIEPIFEHVRNLFDYLPPAEEPEKLGSPVQPEIKKSFTVPYSDIDMHHHVNNTKYMEWILDSYPLEMHQNCHIHTFQINYLAESSHGDEISVHSERVEDCPLAFLHTVVRENDCRELCRARASWGQIDSIEKH
jgi:medium-chain acyl-[acyl-carrier-protein] hydrolase